MIHVKRKALALGITCGLLISACGSTPEGRANKAAGKQTSPAAGRVMAKYHADKSYRLKLRNGGKSRTIYVRESAWIKCQLEDWYAHETCK